MPTTRAARRAAERAAERQITDLSLDEVAHILVRLTLAHDIAHVAPTCRLLRAAAKLALAARPFSGEVVKLNTRVKLSCVSVTPEGHILTGCYKWVQVWQNGVCAGDFKFHDSPLQAVAALPGDLFFSASMEGAFHVSAFDGNRQGRITALCAGPEEMLISVAMLPDGVHFVAGFLGDMHGEVRLYRPYIEDGAFGVAHVHTFTGHLNGVEALAATRDGQHIISGSSDRLVKVWSVASKSLVSTCEGHTHELRSVAAMPDGQRILSGGLDNTIRVWLLNGTLQNTFRLHTNCSVWALVALPDNQHALSGSSDNTVKLFNVNDGAVLRTFTQHTAVVRSLALHPDGLRFVSGAADDVACILYHGLDVRKYN